MNNLKKEYGDKLDVQYRVFMLRPQPDPTAVFNEYRVTGWTNATSQEESADFRLWDSDETFPNCSMPSAKAGIAARIQGTDIWNIFHMNLLQAFFSESRNISDEKVVHEIAEKSGLDMDRYHDDMQGDGLQEKANREFQDATNKGITGIPSVVANDRMLIVGAVPSGHYRQVIDTYLETGSLPESIPL